jgi:hypothetical protein
MLTASLLQTDKDKQFLNLYLDHAGSSRVAPRMLQADRIDTYLSIFSEAIFWVLVILSVSYGLTLSSVKN